MNDMGIDPNPTSLPDLNGGHHYLIDGNKPVPEVI